MANEALDPKIKEFLETLDGLENAYSEGAVLRYCALRHEGRWCLFSGRIRLSPAGATEHRLFEHAEARAGVVPLKAINLTYGELITQLLQTRRLPIPDLEIEFAPDGQSYSAYHVPLHRAINERTDLSALVIRGARSWTMLDQQALGWSLRGGQIPYESLEDLCQDFGLERATDTGLFEVVASPVVRVLDASRVGGGKAVLQLALAMGLDANNVRLSYRVLSNSAVVVRSAISGAELTWIRDAGWLKAEARVDVPIGAALDCTASYLDRTNHHTWVVDKTSILNPRRMALESLDPDLQGLTRGLLEVPSLPRDRDGRGFESAFARLLWLIGFNPIHLGNTKRTEDGVDVVAECEGRGYAVVECTLDILKEDKRSKLRARAVATREHFKKAQAGDVVVVPVLVTQLTEEQVKNVLEAAASEEIAVVTRDEIETMLALTGSASRSTATFDEWLQRAQRGRAASLVPQLG